MSASQRSLTQARVAITRICYACLAAHIGCLVGSEVFYWSFNSPGIVFRELLSNPISYFGHIFDLSQAPNTLAFCIACYRAPIVTCTLIVAAVSIWLCITFRKWKLFFICVFLSFAALKFVLGFAWKVQ
jgi:hypothetical protein